MKSHGLNVSNADGVRLNYRGACDEPHQVVAKDHLRHRNPNLSAASESGSTALNGLLGDPKMLQSLTVMRALS